MSQQNAPETATITYEIKVILEECTHDKRRKVIREEILGRFPSEEEAHEILELVELPDMNHLTII